MHRIALVLSLLLLVAFAVVPANASSDLVQLDPGVGGFMSPNISYVGTIPIDSPGVGGRMVQVGTQKRFYVTGVRGLSIYDVTNPALPLPLGHLQLPHWENEDVEVSGDGNTVIISVDGPGMVVVDTSIVTVPRIVGAMTSGGHTSTCVVTTCDWVYSSNGSIYDLRDKTKPTNTGKKWTTGTGVGSSHDLLRDSSGLVITDSTPRLVLDVTTPDAPVVVAKGSPKGDPRLQHNSIRPRADQWVPRDPASADYADPALRPGELLLGNSELNANTNCSQAGGFSTWSMRDFDQTGQMTQLQVFRPIRGLGDYNSGDPAVNGLGCSGHWFTERDNAVAASWYEHGVRVLDIDPTTGAIAQRAFFQPVVTSASAAHWVTDAAGAEYIYSVDYARGIDILKFNRNAPAPTQAEFDASWLAKLGQVDALAQRERYLCGLTQG